MATRGQKRHLVTLEGPGPVVPDNEGGYTQVPAPLDPSEAWAEIKPATARDLERTVANTVQSTASHIITMDYHPGVNTKTTVVFNGRTFRVTGVQNPDERDIELVLAVEETVA